MKIVLPGQDVSVVRPDGRIDPDLYLKLKAMADFVNLFDNVASTITNGQTVLWNATTKKFEPGAN